MFRLRDKEYEWQQSRVAGGLRRTCGFGVFVGRGKRSHTAVVSLQHSSQQESGLVSCFTTIRRPH